MELWLTSAFGKHTTGLDLHSISFPTKFIQGYAVSVSEVASY